MSAAKRMIEEQLEWEDKHCSECEELKTKCECEGRCPECHEDFLVQDDGDIWRCLDCGYML